MPKYKVEMPNGKSYYVTVPKEATDAELEAAVLRKHPEARGPGRLEAAARGFMEPMENAAADIYRGVFKGLRAVGVPGTEKVLAAFPTAEQNIARRRAPAQQVHPNYFAGGKLAGEVALTAPLIEAGGAGLIRGGGALATKAPTTARVLQATGRAVQTGGVGVQAPTRTGRMALRVAGGGTAGATQAALTDQDIVDAAETGAAIPIIGAIGRHGLGWTYDLLSRRMGNVKAGEILRRLVSERADEVRAALATATDDVKANTAQFLSKVGITIPELAAATEDVTRSAAGAPLLRSAEARGQSIAAGREALRGAPTQTGAMENLAAAKEGLNTVTAPMRETGLQAADVGRQFIVPAERTAEALRGTADEITGSGLVPRMRGLEERASEQAALMGDMPAIFPNMEGIQKTRGIAGAAGQRADTAMAQQIGLRDAARTQEQAAANLRELGFQPLDVSSVVSRLRQEASNAEFVNPARFKILSAFADNLQNRANKFGGVIDAGGLYELQKNMGSAISDLLGPTDPKSLQKYTAQIIGEVKPMISAAIAEAGGPSGNVWSQYMDTFAKGMRQIEQDDFARTLADLPEAELTKVMRGDNPEFVSNFFGPGHFDITAELPAGKLPGAQALAGDIQAGQDVANLGLGNLSEADRAANLAGVRTRTRAAMEPGIPNLLYRAGARMLGGQAGVYGAGNAAQQLEQVYSNKLYENVLRRLAPALASPQAAQGLLDTQSSANTMANLLAKNPDAARLMSLGTINYFNGKSPR